jgi:quercetin dioxygenase-like cupin family protein
VFLRSFTEGEPFRCAGNDFVMLLPRDLGGCCEAVLQIVQPGCQTPPNAHESFLQIYLILAGKAEVHIGQESRVVSGPAIAFIPPKTNHWVVNTSPDQRLQYLYISVWPDGIPAAEKDGGWRKVYRDIVQEYVDRGYPQNGSVA